MYIYTFPIFTVAVAAGDVAFAHSAALEGPMVESIGAFPPVADLPVRLAGFSGSGAPRHALACTAAFSLCGGDG